MRTLLSIFAGLAGLAGLASCQTQPSESITGTNLLGDHFGVPSTNATFDYVIVGGGTAGLALAARLALNGTVSVAVIEAGGFSEMDNGNYSSIPAQSGHFSGTAPASRNPRIDWQYQTEPSEGLGERSIAYNSGKTLGGASARNAMVYARAPKSTYSMWSQQVNDSSYEFENFLPYYQRSLTFDAPDATSRASNASGGTQPPMIGEEDGPLHVTLPSWTNAIGSYAATALRALGLQQFEGVVGGALSGFGYLTFTIDGKSQTRSSAETSYLRYALAKTSNMVLYTNTLARKILFNSDGEAVAVIVSAGGTPSNLTARKEVILAAGAFRSPQMLMLSGVGPRDALESLGIPVISEQPGVGQSMWDQPFFGPSYPVSLTTHTALGNNPAFAAEQTQLYRKNRTGMLTNPSFDFIAWGKIPDPQRSNLSAPTRSSLDESFPADWPELQTIFSDGFSGYNRDRIVGALNGAPADGRMYVSIISVLGATFSRGNVTINSTDAGQNPIIYPALLTDVRDQEQAVAAFRRTRQIAQTPAMQQVIVGEEAWPGADVASYTEILDLIKQSAAPLWHASCTCKMGMADDPMAVVDSKGRVKGMRRLRVVDASVFPFLTPNQPSATVYALAEMIAEDILQSR